VLDADEFGEPRFDHYCPSVSPAQVMRTFRRIRRQDAVATRKSLRGAAVRATRSCKSRSFPQGGLSLLRHKPLMVRSAKRVSNHEARLWPASFETTAPRSPQDED